MSLEGASNNRLPTDLSTQIGGAGQVIKKVLENPAKPETGQSAKIQGNGATVTGSGKSEAASGKALLEMMSNPNGMVLVRGFSNGKTERELIDEPTIKTHTEAFLVDGPEANKQFQRLMNRASRGAESISGKVSPLELGGQAVIPLENKDGQFANALRLAFSLADRQPITTEAIVNSFHEAKE